MFTVTNLIAFITRNRRFTPGGIRQYLHVHTSQTNPGVLLEMAKSVIPPLTYSSHKGNMGRIGIIGGSKEYTGAPYFAAMSALKLGADLTHVFCAENAATVIKSYSAELIVHPILDHKSSAVEIDDWLQRLHAVVVGPGLGREMHILKNTMDVIEKIKDRGIPLVIDADGLHLVTEHPDVVKNYKKAILTPNIVEFTRLYEKMMQAKPDPNEAISNVKTLCRALGNVTIVQKGENDIITDGENVLVCCGEGSPRRCGGQGDLLSGTMGTFSYWAHLAAQGQNTNKEFLTYGPTITAAYAACLITKRCNKQAYEEFRRSTTTTDMLDQIQSAFEYLYE